MLSFAVPDKALIRWLAETPLFLFRMLKNCSWDKNGLIAVERVKSFLSSKMNFIPYVTYMCTYCKCHTVPLILNCSGFTILYFKECIAIMKG